LAEGGVAVTLFKSEATAYGLIFYSTPNRTHQKGSFTLFRQKDNSDTETLELD